MAGSQLYSRKVMNKSGSVIIFPNVASMEEFYDGSTSVDPYGQSDTQLFPLGTRLIRGEREWMYAKNGAGALTAGMATQGAVIPHADADYDIASATVSAIGSYTVGITGATNIAAAANYYKEGYVFTNDLTGEGYAYKIKSHIAIANAVECILNLYDPVVVATDATTQYGLRKNAYDMVIVAAAPLTNVFTGIATRAVTAAYYFWLQVKGPCAVNSHAAITTGQEVVVGTTAGQADPSTADNKALQMIGVAMMTAVTDTEKFLVYLGLSR